MTTSYKPKLIEVSLPLAVINTEAAREKSIRHGHPSTLHLWWARRPLATARAVIWASLVDDPSGDPTLTEAEQTAERERLFGILERLVKWENSNNPDVLAEARAEIDRCFPDGPPPILDPFGGGGAIPLEAQRLGLTALSGDLNPVAVLIQKAMIEIPPRFAGLPPVNPAVAKELKTWERAQGLAADVAAYGEWMREEAHKRIGHLYPDVDGPDGQKLTPIAWIWARTVESPDPSWHGQVPLVASWTLANKPGKPKTWIEPIINREKQTISYETREGGEPTYDRTVKNGKGTCIATRVAISPTYIKSEARNGRMRQQLIAIVCEGAQGRVYLGPTPTHEATLLDMSPSWKPPGDLPEKGLGFRVQAYGIEQWSQLFTDRQLTTLSTYSDLLPEVRQRAVTDALAAGFGQEPTRLSQGGTGAEARADAVVTYLALGLSRLTDMCNALCRWESSRTQVRNLFGRQAIPMIWDFAENNVFNDAGGDYRTSLGSLVRTLERLPVSGTGSAVQRDARARITECPGAVVSTDPPYYDNVGYADLSDFFFVWLRHNLADVWPDECATLLTPKSGELIADPDRAGSRTAAEKHFEAGMADVMAAIAASQAAGVPATIYYAYKATESRNGEKRSTGWDTFLQAVLDAGLQVNATWPMRTELANRMRGHNSNALASSIVLVCRPRQVDAALATRGEFIAALRAELPGAVRILQAGNIAPVDVAQSTIGPGIKVFSRFAKVVESDGSEMRVSTALGIINDVLSEVLDGEESELDADTRFAVTWYAQNGYNPASSGDADSQARAKNTSLDGLRESGIGEARAGKFRLFERSELDPGWDPVADHRPTVWEATQHLVAALDRSESEAAELLARLGGYGDRARQLAYLLFHKATEKGWADEAGAYNGLITAWPALQAGAGVAAAAVAGEGQGSLM